MSTATPFVQPYLFFNGNCEEAIKFYQAALGAEVLMMMRFSECPVPSNSGQVPAGYENKIMHASFRLGQSTIMASDGCGQSPAIQGFSLALNVSSDAEVDRLFSALAEGGQVRLAPEKTFWTSRFSMVEDKFGVGWMVSTEPQIN